MAELGVAASIIALVGTGTKLSIAIFDFAATVGGAGKELQHVATEISGLCSVLQHLRALLTHAHFKPSPTAVASVQKITNHCESTFSEIDAVVTGLRGNITDSHFPATTPDFANRVKWTFKKSKVTMLRSSLEACKSTLSLMLSTLLLAQRVAQGEIEESDLLHDEQGKAVTQSLVIAQQCAVEQLEHDEDEVEKEQEAARLLPGVAAAKKTTQHRKSKGRLIRMFSGLSVVTDLPAPYANPVAQPVRAKRASIWLDDILAPPGDEDDPHPGIRRQKRLSSAGTANAPMELLRKWTDLRSDSVAGPGQNPTAEIPLADIWRDSKFAFPSGDRANTQAGASRDIVPEIRGIARVATDFISPKTGRVHSLSFHKVVGFEGSLEHTAITRLDDEHDADLDSVKKAMMQDYGLTVTQEHILLCVYFGGKTRVLKKADRPLEVLRQYEEMEMDPRLFLRHAV
ncbi:hypothetical protein B0A48_09831 [Cryoendolithus antarcticus]|uniref:Fungal N-terminal domain-containing protein n=1 Tax=Cryoendolithus antarcticus TaxID=1507870 RepID=A0A1V8T2U3_9PEZI|nr:hypothetical protein B0A48_09831 [Cryoendolithus antarcticus]